MPDTRTFVSSMKLPGGSVVYFADDLAREQLEAITGAVSGVMHYIGPTTTALTDGAGTSPIQVDGKAYTPNGGDVVSYNNMEFAWSSTTSKWFEFGSTGALKALAFKDSASGTVTPTGTVSKPSFTGTAGNVSVSGTPTGSVAISKGNGTANYTPEGTVAVTPTVTVSKTTVKPFGTAGSLPTLEFNVNGDSLDISWSQGTLPTAGTDVSVASDIASASATATFTGTGAELKGTFTGNALNSTGTFTPAGEVSKPNFTGTGAELKAAFSGNALNSTGKFTPAGEVSQPTFTGDQKTVTVS